MYHGFDPARQGLREALCSLGNGYFVTRGALPRPRPTALTIRAPTSLACTTGWSATSAGRQVENEDLVNLPNWLHCSSGLRAGRGSTCSGPRSTTTALSWTCAWDAHPPADLARRGRPADRSGPAPVRQPQGRASGPPGDRVHRGELDGHARGPFGPGRHSGQRGGAAVPRPGRPPPEDTGPGRGRPRDGRLAGRDAAVAGAGRPGGPHPAIAGRRDRRGRPQAGRGTWVRGSPAHRPVGAGSPGHRREDRGALHVPRPRHLREPP